MMPTSHDVSLVEYKTHLERLYCAVEHLFGWLKRISRAAGELDGQWIDTLILDLHRLDTSAVARLATHRQQFDLSGWVLRLVEITDLSIIADRTVIMIGFYFPLHFYPAVDGVYPKIEIRAGNKILANIQLDGTRRLYKPFDDNFWLHLNISPVTILNLNTGGAVCHMIAVMDNVGIEKEGKTQLATTLPDGSSISYGLDDIQRYMAEAPIIDGTDPRVFYWMHANSPHVLSYPYVRAANLIKRAWIRYAMRKKKRALGLELRAVPGVGVEAIELFESYRSDGRFGS